MNGQRVVRRLEFTGPAFNASRLVSALEQEGVEVEWTPPTEYRGAPQMAQDVVVTILATGALDAIKTAVTKAREKWDARVKGDDEDASGHE